MKIVQFMTIISVFSTSTKLTATRFMKPIDIRRSTVYVSKEQKTKKKRNNNPLDN